MEGVQLCGNLLLHCQGQPGLHLCYHSSLKLSCADICRYCYLTVIQVAFVTIASGLLLMCLLPEHCLCWQLAQRSTVLSHDVMICCLLTASMYRPAACLLPAVLSGSADILPVFAWHALQLANCWRQLCYCSCMAFGHEPHLVGNLQQACLKAMHRHAHAANTQGLLAAKHRVAVVCVQSLLQLQG